MPETSLKVNFRAKVRIFSLRFVRELCCGGYLRCGSLPMSCWSEHPWLKLRECLSDGTKKLVSRVEYGVLVNSLDKRLFSLLLISFISVIDLISRIPTGFAVLSLY